MSARNEAISLTISHKVGQARLLRSLQRLDSGIGIFFIGISLKIYLSKA